MIPIEIKKLEKSRVEISGEIPTEKWELYKAKALEAMGKRMEVDGFRKGNVPASIVEKNVPASSILEEMAELALRNEYIDILDNGKVDAIGKPDITITKLAYGNPLGFKIVTAVLPEVKLPDYKKIAKAHGKKVTPDDIKVEDKELEETILEIRRMKAHKDLHAKQSPLLDEEGVGGGDSDTHHNHEELKEDNLPPFDEEFVKSLGAFETIEDFKNKLIENIKLEKAQKEKEKNRIAIIDKILEETETELPQLIIDAELEKMLAQMRGDVERAGIKFDDYIKHLQKTEDELKKDWEKDAIKRAKLELTIHNISKTENLVAEEEEIQNEIKKILDMYKGADPDRARAYVESILNGEKVFRFLEEQI